MIPSLSCAKILLGSLIFSVLIYCSDFINRDLKAGEILTELRIPFINPGMLFGISDDHKLSTPIKLGAGIMIGFGSYKLAIRSQNVHPVRRYSFFSFVVCVSESHLTVVKRDSY
jgi:hypothetical protein